jgi:hypothetical protein
MDLSDTTKAPPRPGAAVRAIRLLVVGGVLVAGWFLLETFSDLFHAPPPAPTPSDGLTENLAPPLLDLGLAAGPWSIAGAPWRLRINRLPEAAVSAALEKPPPARVAAGATADWERALIALAARGDCRHNGAQRVYRTQKPDLRAVLFTRVDGAHERVLAGRLAAVESNGAWVILDVTPADGAVPIRQANAELLPSLADARSLAARYDEQGNVLAQLATIALPPEALVRRWEQDGWTVHSLPGKRPSLAAYVGCRGAERVQAWMFESGKSGSQFMVFLVHMPAAPLGAGGK